MRLVSRHAPPSGFMSSSPAPFSRHVPAYQAALGRCVAKLAATMPVIGLRNPKIGRDDLTWTYCGPFDWVAGFRAGQLWLAYQLTGEPSFANNARARRPVFQGILGSLAGQDHDLGFQFSLSCVAEWLMTGDREARDMALGAATALAARFNSAGNYIQAWNPLAPHLPERSAFVNGRVIADSMINLALLHWAHGPAGRPDFRDIAEAHAGTVADNIVRADGTSYHCFLFDPATGRPVAGETHQGHAADSCWSRGQAWLINGFAQCYSYTRNPRWLDTARLLAARTEELLAGGDAVPWDYLLPPGVEAHPDSSAAAATASGLYLLAGVSEESEAARWRSLADRLLDGLLAHSDLTGNPDALGMLDHGASHVRAGRARAMLPYGDYYFMEALMRALGHDVFFW